MSTAETSPATTRGRRRPKREDVRRDLLVAAARVFAQKGINGASVDDVAAEADYTKGAVYSNFGSKSGLIDAVVADRTSSIVEFGVDAAASTRGPLAAKGRALGDRLDEKREDQRDWLLLYLELWQRAVRDESIAQEFRSQHSGNLDQITSVVEAQLEESGSTVDFSPRELAVLISALSTGLAMEALIAPDEVPAGLLGRAMARIVAP